MKRTNETWERLERTYGKGLVGMRDPKTNKIDFNRMGWDNHKTGGRQLGSSIGGRYGMTITNSINGFTFDATTGAAFLMGWSKAMQYSGLDREDAMAIVDTEALSNCFAATYAMITTMDNMGYAIENLSTEPGSFRAFDAYISGPTLVFADMTVNFEMCEYNKIIDQVKNMAGLDYASIADNAVREMMVLITESPEAMRMIKDLKAAGECAMQVAVEAKEDVEAFIEEAEAATGQDFEEDWGSDNTGSGDDEQFESFQADA